MNRLFIAVLALWMPMATGVAQGMVSGNPEQPQPAVQEVPVPKVPLQKGATITADDLTTAQIPAAQVFPSTITSAEDLVGLQPVRPLPAGQPVNRLHVKATPKVARNSNVTLKFERNGVELTASGQALEDGQVGQTIRAINPVTRSPLAGRVEADGTLTVN